MSQEFKHSSGQINGEWHEKYIGTTVTKIVGLDGELDGGLPISDWFGRIFKIED